MKRTFEFRNCVARVDYLTGRVETEFRDGSKVLALPQPTADYRTTAERLGYGSDIAALCREHELLHTWLMERLGFAVSPTLWAVAHHFAAGTAAVSWQLHEETVVCEFQRVLNTPALQRLLPACYLQQGLPAERWVNWIDLRRSAWRLLRETEPERKAREEQWLRGRRAPRRG